MYDPPMHSMDDGIQYLTDPEHDVFVQEHPSTAPQCWKCVGTGRLVLKNSQADKADSSSIDDNGVITYFRECSICCNKVKFPLKDNSIGRISKFVNYSPSGPLAHGDVDDPAFQPRRGETLCSLSGHYMIYQYTKGHRFTTDDVCTAYFAYNEMKEAIIGNRAQNIKQNLTQNLDNNTSGLSPSPSSSQSSSHLDLGCGLGSVLLMLKWKFGDSIKQSIGVEAQGANLDLARRSITYNGLEVRTARCGRCTMCHIVFQWCECECSLRLFDFTVIFQFAFDCFYSTLVFVPCP
jgi:hypothetical protein